MSETRWSITYRSDQNFSYRYINTLESYHSKFQSIPNGFEYTNEYRVFRPKKENRPVREQEERRNQQKKKRKNCVRNQTVFFTFPRTNIKVSRFTPLSTLTITLLNKILHFSLSPFTLPQPWPSPPPPPPQLVPSKS